MFNMTRRQLCFRSPAPALNTSTGHCLCTGAVCRPQPCQHCMCCCCRQIRALNTCVAADACASFLTSSCLSFTFRSPAAAFISTRSVTLAVAAARSAALISAASIPRSLAACAADTPEAGSERSKLKQLSCSSCDRVGCKHRAACTLPSCFESTNVLHCVVVEGSLTQHGTAEHQRHRAHG